MFVFAILLLALGVLSVAIGMFIRVPAPPTFQGAPEDRMAQVLHERRVEEARQASAVRQGFKQIVSIAGIALSTLGIALFVWASVKIVPTSYNAVVTVLGETRGASQTEGPHIDWPWAKYNNVFIGVDVAAVVNADAGSKNTQSVWSDITVNYTVDNPRELFRLNPSLNYEVMYVNPAMLDVFKATAAMYSAEELVTKRTEVGEEFLKRLNIKLRPYHMVARTANLTNFKYSAGFNAAIERKVIADKDAATAESLKAKAGFDAESRVLIAKGEAEAIRIQSQAIQQSGGISYVMLKWVEKWNGVQPHTQLSGQPLINIPAAAPAK